MMGNYWVLRFHLVFLSFFSVATIYTCVGAQNLTRSCHERERLALLEFKHSVNDDYELLSSWVGMDCCSWKGVRCDGATGSVVSLYLRGNFGESMESTESMDYLESHYLVGDKVNANLAELRHLQHLDLSGNDFKESRIPKFVGSFQELSYLNLSNARFSGIIPNHIRNLSSLKVLDLSSNFFIGPNDMTWVSGLSSLEHLDLSELYFLQAINIDMVFYMIPSLSYLSLRSCSLTTADLDLHLNSSKLLPKIEHLDLGSNNFEGQLPHFFQNMTSLTFLDLSSYNLSLAWNFVNLRTMIPSLSELHLSNCDIDNAFFSPTYFNFSAHSHIQYLDLSDNTIGVRFPSELMNLTSLKVLDLSENGLNSLIPVMPNLLKLDVSGNNFEHTELVGIWRQCHLKELRLSDNNFGGEMLGSLSNMSECSTYALEVLESYESGLKGLIPESVGKLNNLRVLNLATNNFTGSIPKALERLRSLEELNMYDNHLTGHVPSFHGKLTKLDLSNNQLSGSIPESLERFKGLTYLSLSSNLLTGPIPISIGQLTKLILLDVSGNSLEGVVSEAHFANLSMLKGLDLSSNQKLIFNISHEWIPPFQLRYVQLSSCKHVNGFPRWLQNQRKLQWLVLSNASLYGLLPTWFRNMPMHYALDLSHNKLTGSFLSLPFKYTSLLILKDNLFNGSIPRSMCRTSLAVLDVSSNQLSGNIPDCVESLQHMSMLILGSNRLSGVLPSSLGNINSSLTWLKLNENNFSGQIPQNLKNLVSLRVLDLGNNKLSGYIPKWIGDYSRLMILRLQKNNFIGGISNSLCNCSYLHILDIAHNNLTDSIPYCIGELSGMIEAREEYYQVYEYIDSMNVIQIIKGIELEYTTTMGLVINMDLSSNKLTGEIPPEITALALLMGLNLSHNHLSGSIPDTIGNMKALNSLDLSYNRLTGTIPPSMAALNFLSFMNLSHNNLSGKIPTGNQLQTLTDPSVYADNMDLCGAPLPNNCSSPEYPPATTSKNKYKNANAPKNIWLYLDITYGFATGFWGIIGVLSFKKQWRRKLFTIAAVTVDKVFVAVAVKISKIRRGREAI